MIRLDNTDFFTGSQHDGVGAKAVEEPEPVGADSLQADPLLEGKCQIYIFTSKNMKKLCTECPGCARALFPAF